jgi:hypothetical protein
MCLIFDRSRLANTVSQGDLLIALYDLAKMRNELPPCNQPGNRPAIEQVRPGAKQFAV